MTRYGSLGVVCVSVFYSHYSISAKLIFCIYKHKVCIIEVNTYEMHRHIELACVKKYIVDWYRDVMLSTQMRFSG